MKNKLLLSIGTIMMIFLVGCGEADNKKVDIDDGTLISDVQKETTIAADDKTAVSSDSLADIDEKPLDDATGVPQVYSYANYLIENGDGEYLSCSDGKITTSINPYLWMFEPVQKADYKGSYKVTVAENGEYKTKMFDINNAWYKDGNSVSIYVNTGYSAQYWEIEEVTIDGETGIIFKSAEDSKFVLHKSDEGYVITTSDKLTRDDLYTLTMVEDTENNTMMSANGVMQFTYEKRLLEVISEQKLQQWLDNYEQAYYAFVELQGSAPFDKVYIFDTEIDKNYWAAYCGNGVIRIVPDCAYREFEIIAGKDEDDISFGMLHELGHLFDDGKSWVFEAEAMTDIKIPYILKKTGFYGAPSEYGDTRVFSGDDIVVCYKEQSSSLEQKYGPYEMAYKMSVIYEEVGYDVLQEVLQNFPDTAGMSKYEIFETWLDMNTEYSGKDVKEMFSAKELENIKTALNK